MDNRINEKATRHLIQWSMREYGWLCNSKIIVARLTKKTVAAGPNPPAVVTTRGTEWFMFNWGNSLLIAPSFLYLISPMTFPKWSLDITLNERIEDSHNTKGSLTRNPKPCCSYINLSKVLTISWHMRQDITCQLLQVRFNNNIVTSFCKETCCNIANFISPSWWKTTTLAVQGVFNG